MMFILPSISSISDVFACRPCLSDTNLKPLVCARGRKGSHLLTFFHFSFRRPFKNLVLLQRLLLEMPLVLYSDSLLSVFMEVKLSVEVMLLMFYYKFFLLGPHLEKMSVSFQVPLSYRTLINNLKCVPEDAKGTILFHPLKSTQCSPLHGTMLFGYVSVPGRTVVHFWGLFLFILLNTFCYVVVTQQLHTAALELLVFISNVIA